VQPAAPRRRSRAAAVRVAGPEDLDTVARLAPVGLRHRSAPPIFGLPRDLPVDVLAAEHRALRDNGAVHLLATLDRVPREQRQPHGLFFHVDDEGRPSRAARLGCRSRITGTSSRAAPGRRNHDDVPSSLSRPPRCSIVVASSPPPGNRNAIRSARGSAASR
jgi:hypothetical protein